MPWGGVGGGAKGCSGGQVVAGCLARVAHLYCPRSDRRDGLPAGVCVCVFRAWSVGTLRIVFCRRGVGIKNSKTKKPDQLSHYFL